MKIRYFVLLVFVMIVTQACASSTTSNAGSPADQPQMQPATETQMPDSPQPVVETSLPSSGSVTVVEATGDVATLPVSTSSENTGAATGSNNPIPENGITMDDNGKTFEMNVGDSFVLKLGADQYNWDVSVDNENVLHLKMGVLLVRGAQGIYDALAPGTATVRAAGDPLCRQSKPACAMPSLLFTVYVVVQ